MASFIPISISGDNLGQRQRCLNSLVRQAYDSGASFQDIEAQPERSPIDRLFKIDLASKLKNVDYILRNLKDDDMLFVSRALKCTWLLNRHDMVNPNYLEEVLFPEMITQAISKMKHWLYINLLDPSLCQEFYKYYKENAFEFAVKFLGHCSHEFIMDEVPKILTKISTHHLKILSEKCPKVAKIYFDSLAVNEDVRNSYLRQERAYYDSVKCVLKSDGDVFLDIMEKYFNVNWFNRLSPSATDYILRCHKTRFTNKLELYVAYLLHIPTLANRLSVEECQEVVMKLARAKYLQHWFQYKVVEPLVKRLSPDKRSAFKKRVFLEKDVGELVDEWPYEVPNSPPYSDSYRHVFDDQDFDSVCEDYKCEDMVELCSARYCCRAECVMPIKSELDRLFDEYRFIGFDRTLREFGQKLGATGSADRRRDMFLVLVSKTGGRSEAVSALLRLAARHSNESAHTRAAVLRSLVKRAKVWRLPADDWQHLLHFGHGLGLDGAPSEAACHEGLHAVVIRNLLDGKCELAVRNAFLNNFSTLAEYLLSAEERTRVVAGLQDMLAESSVNVDPEVAVQRLNQLLDVLEKYHVCVNPKSPIVQTAIDLALRDREVARPVLERLYDAKIARRELFRVNLEFRKDEASLLNVLRHDPLALEQKWVVDTLSANESRFDRFISKLVLYFGDKEGFVTQLRTTLSEKFTQEQNVKLARPLARLIGIDLKEELHKLDAAGTGSIKLAAALRACAHLARPAIKLAGTDWRTVGVKAVATQAMCCREVERAELTRVLAAERRTVRVALALSMRSKGGLLLDTFESAAKLRPSVALRAAVVYLHRHGAKADLKVWDIVKPLLLNIDLSSREYLRRLLGNTDWVPLTIKADYCSTLYFVLYKISSSKARRVLLCLSNLLPELSDDIIENILLQMLDNTDKDVPAIQNPSLFIRYLMLSRDDEDFRRRFEKIGERFLERLDNLHSEKNSNFPQTLNQIIKSLKYNAAFFDTKYTSCLLVIEKILSSMQKFMPKEEYFKVYVDIHITMLYFKAVRQSIKQMPDVFADDKRKTSEGVDAVGYVFGRYIAKEIADLVDTYFDSILELYSEALVHYLRYNFLYGSTLPKFTGAVIKGMLAEGVGSQRRIAVYVFSDQQHIMEDPAKKEIEELMVKDKTIELFVHAELFT